MEFSSSYISVLERLASDREQLILIFTFGAMGVAFVMFILMALLKRMGFHQFIVNAVLILSIALLISILVGLVSQLLLMMSGVSGIKMILIWVIMFIVIILYLTYNFSGINKKINKNMK
ncbi:hypothetical protein [Flavobacterium sp. H122]|uniref:hypothetical protein n=1 Tax=Flavobacterium sp. H122 TaxID=2529860 RepID=UPI0010AAB3A0|nr:hypothetical protein [Flavobacterium sp. H122]